MSSGMKAFTSRWPLIVPLAGAAILLVALLLPLRTPIGAVCAVALIGAVLAAVHHAEVVAHRVGEPFGTLVLALAVTAIETSLIVSVMLAGGEEKATLARDTMYAAIMIVVNGVVGASVLVGALRHREQAFRVEGAGPALAALATLATLVLVMPAFTVSAPGPRYTRRSSPSSRAVVAGAVVRVRVLPDGAPPRLLPAGRRRRGRDGPCAAADQRAGAGQLRAAAGLARRRGRPGEGAVADDRVGGSRRTGAPPAVVGVAIALLVLMPESIAAIRAALADRLQTSVNLAFGSALATIGLTVPVVVVVHASSTSRSCSVWT